MATRMAVLAILLCALSPITPWPPATSAQSQADPETGTRRRAAASITARHAMVVTANGHATRAGLAALRAGGNAVDAAAAAQFVLNVVEPQSSGIGGGGFLLIYLAGERKVVAIDGREQAPAAAGPDMFLQPDGKPQRFYPERITGGNAVGVPGLVLALESAVRRHGRLSLARALEPAIRLAEEGFEVSPRLAGALARHRKRLEGFAATRAVFFGRGGAPLKAGDRLVQRDLAATFRLLAARGSGVFYRGEIARDIVHAVRKAPVNPGRMTAGDLAGYSAPERAPVRGRYRGYTLYGMGPPSSGGVTAFQLLHLLEQAPRPAGGAHPAMRIHRFVQAARLAYADRARYLADPDFVRVPVVGLLAPDYASSRAASLDWAAPLVSVEAGVPEGAPRAAGSDASGEHPSTTHLSVVDEARNVVALTSSVEQAFGSAMVVPGRGFLLNNQLTDFSARPADAQGRPIANRAEGGKRPRSSMAPTIVLKDGQPVLVIGSPGGSRIIQYVARVLLEVLGAGRGLQDAISAPHATHLGKRTFLEPAPGTDDQAKRLRRLGHEVRIREQNSGLHGIRIDLATGILHGGVDPRREGTAEGY